MRGIDTCTKASKYMELQNEVYNALTPCGMPPHILRLKKVIFSSFCEVNTQ